MTPARKDTDTLNLNAKNHALALGLLVRRVSTALRDNGANHEAFKNEPATVATLFANYLFNTPNAFTK